MIKLKTAIAAAAVMASASVASAASVIYATDVIATTPGVYDVTSPPERQVTANALGAPDGSFYSLGVGGDITLGFGENFFGGTDVAVYEVTFGDIASHVESIDVFAISGGSETLIGSISNEHAQGGFKLTFAGAFQALRLADTSPADGGTLDGFDIDAVGVEKVPAPASALLLLAGVAGFGALRRRAKKA